MVEYGDPSWKVLVQFLKGNQQHTNVRTYICTHECVRSYIHILLNNIHIHAYMCSYKHRQIQSWTKLYLVVISVWNLYNTKKFQQSKLFGLSGNFISLCKYSIWTSDSCTTTGACRAGTTTSSLGVVLILAGRKRGRKK